MSLQPVILCGGYGVRLWPLSSEIMPKQFLKIFNGKSLFELTLERAFEINPKIKPIIVASQKHEDLINDTLKRKNVKAKVLLEPMGKNTTVSIYLAAKFSQITDTMIVMPSDHIIPEKSTFAQMVKKVHKNFKNNFWMTFGVRPIYPSVSYGYIQVQMENETKYKILDVKTFCEKPSLDEAIGMIKNGDYLWNSGIFMANTNFVLMSIKKHSNFNSKKIDQIYDSIQFSKNFNNIHFDIEQFQSLKQNSIDYEVIEKEDRIKCAIMDTQWSDVGSWDNAFQHITSKENSNNTFQIDGKNNILNRSQKLIATVGIDDLFIINDYNKLLITKRNKSEKIRELVTIMENAKLNSDCTFHTVRPWGGFDIFFESEICKVKKLTILPRKRISLQYHNRRSEHWYVVSGTAYVHLDGNEFKLEKGKSIDIKKLSHHYLANEEKENLIVIEIQLGDYFGEDDIIRLNDPYNR